MFANFRDSTLGITTQDNGGFGYTDITQDGFIEHNYFHGNGLTSIDHQLYVETSGAAVQYNLFGTPRASSGGFQIKPRSSDLIIDGNVIWDFGSGNGQRCVDYVEFQGEGAAPYYSPATWVGQGFNTVGTQTPSIDKIISNNDRAERARIQGNFCKTDGLFPYHFSADHAFDGDNNPGGRLFFQYNTQAQGAFGILQQASPAGDYAVNPYYQPEVHLKNNILLTNRPSSDPAFAMAAQVRDVYYYGPDLYVANTVVLPPTPGTGSPRGDWNGWGSFVASYASNYELPIIDHVSGATSANMIFTASQTIDPNTFTLPEAANKAATLTGEEAYDLPRYWMNPNTGVLTARTAYTDLGAVQRGGNVRHP